MYHIINQLKNTTMTTDKTKKYEFGNYTIKFHERDNIWCVINMWGFGVYSNKSFTKCKQVLKEL